jgi:hypothetical protein
MAEGNSKGWTFDTWETFSDERDRRYAEVQIERARALAYKEKGDQTALELARAHQHYLDVKANELREQLGRERGDYVNQAQFKPISDWVTAQQGGSKVWNAVVAIALTLAGFALAWLLRGGQ